jgi:ABC-type transport system involved in multi-copper enzyme maturation permease subunit
MKIKAIALNTFREAIKDRVLYLLLFFAAISFLFSRVLSLLTVGDEVKVIKDVGLASLSIFGALIAILIGTSLVSKEIDKKTIYTLLPKPIQRYQFLVGKFFGLISVLFVMLFLMAVVFLLLIFLHSFTIEWKMLAAVYFIFIELCLLTAVAIFFSCISSPILSSIFSLSFYLIGHLSWGLETLILKMPAGFGKTLTQILYTILPDLENFNFKTEVVYGLPIPAQFYLHSTIYGAAYTAFILILAILIFRKKDFI